jgi:hypothetical protein
MTPQDAIHELNLCGVRHESDFHALNWNQVDSLLERSKVHKYRKPKHANGSTARYFHARLQRIANKDSRS